jgi:hypothetical protein
MSVLTKPRGNIDLGHVMIDGRKLPVTISVEWDRYLTLLDLRAGGITGLGTMDVDAGYYAAMQPMNTGGADMIPEFFQPCGIEVSLGDTFQTGGDCCLPDMIFQG